MNSDLPTVEQLAEFSLAAQHPLTRQWLDDKTRLERLAEIHEFDLELATDLELAEQRAAFFDVGQDAASFLNRWVSVPPDLHAMLSIRFQGLDVTKPFVDASLLSRPLTELDVPALAEIAREIYGAFKPLYLRLWSAAPAGHFAGTQSDKRFLAAPLAELSKGDAPPELSLSPARDLAHYADAQAAYDNVDAQHPKHTGQARMQDDESLLESIEAGTLFDVWVGGEWAGYVGANSDTEGDGDTLGLDAYVVQEIILAPAFRGHGYGAALSTLLARSLPEQQRVLIGTIHAENWGAITGALRAGRVDVGGWVQVGL
ncbi:GNAT family N-acetyltransferase [Deinococcus sp.]|uniref:GNAT family N-acetyltransferase n=1 Tax=Deinococcus sp. TaxID=47478 RepID=UPI003B5C8EBA